jgi:hypothetical protein
MSPLSLRFMARGAINAQSPLRYTNRGGRRHTSGVSGFLLVTFLCRGKEK